MADTARTRIGGGMALFAILVVATLASAKSAFASLLGETKNPTNTFASGSVNLSDNASGTSILSMTGGSPGSTAQSCVTLTYTGSLASALHLYASDSGTLGPYLTLTITQGTGTVAFGTACSGFTPDASGSQIYSGTLSNFTSAYQNFATGLSLANASASTTWSKNNTRVYQFAVTMAANNSAQGQSSNVTFTWEAQQT